MAKPFYFWQTVSKKAKFGWFGLFKGQMATLRGGIKKSQLRAAEQKQQSKFFSSHYITLLLTLAFAWNGAWRCVCVISRFYIPPRQGQVKSLSSLQSSSRSVLSKSGCLCCWIRRPTSGRSIWVKANPKNRCIRELQVTHAHNSLPHLWRRLVL